MQHHIVADFIKAEGHRVRIETHPENPRCHRVSFKSQGVRYFVGVNEDDPEFLIISVSYVLKKQPPKPDLLALAAKVEAAGKAVKLEFDETGVTVAVEQFFEPPHAFKPVFWRCISAVNSGADSFFRELRHYEQADPEQEAFEAAQRFLAEFPEAAQ
jgi:hypothetical protein